MSALHINKDNYQNEVVNSDKKVLLDSGLPGAAPARWCCP